MHKVPGTPPDALGLPQHGHEVAAQLTEIQGSTDKVVEAIQGIGAVRAIRRRIAVGRTPHHVQRVKQLAPTQQKVATSQAPRGTRSPRIDRPPTCDSGSVHSHTSSRRTPSATADPSALHSQLP